MSRGMWILLTMVALVGGYVAFDLYWSDREEKKKSEESSLLTLKKDAINSIEIKSLESSPIELKKVSVKDSSSPVWQIVMPNGGSEIASQESVEEFLTGLSLEKYQEIITENATDLKIFGLDTTPTILTIGASTGKEVFKMGTLKNFQGEPYLQKNEDKKVYLAGSSWISKFQKIPLDFRDRRWLRAEYGQLQSIKVIRGKHIASLEKKDGKWMTPEHPDWILDASKVEALLSGLNQSKVIDFNSNADPRKALKVASKKAVQSEVRIELMLVDGQKWNASLVTQEPPAKVDAANAQRAPHEEMDPDAFSIADAALKVRDFSETAKVEVSEARKWRELTLDSLRDRKLPFTFDETEVQQIDISIGSGTSNIKLVKDEWVLLKEDASILVDSQKAKALIEKAKNLEVDVFLDGASASVSPQRKVVFRKSDGTEIFQMEAASEIDRNDRGLVRHLFPVKTSKYGGIVGVDRHAFNGLDLQDIVRPRPQNKTPGSK